MCKIHSISPKHAIGINKWQPSLSVIFPSPSEITTTGGDVVGVNCYPTIDCAAATMQGAGRYSSYPTGLEQQGSP